MKTFESNYVKKANQTNDFILLFVDVFRKADLAHIEIVMVYFYFAFKRGLISSKRVDLSNIEEDIFCFKVFGKS